MKKIVLKTLIVLIIGLIFENAIYNLIFYNYYINDFIMDNKFISVLAVILFFLAPFVTIYFARIISQKSIANICDGLDKKEFNVKYRFVRLFIGLLNCLSHLSLIIYYVFREIQASQILYDYNWFCRLFGYETDRSYFSTPIFSILLHYTIFFLWFLIIGIATYRIIRYAKTKKKNPMRFLFRLIFILIACLMTFSAIYYYIPINEFKYAYSFYDEYDEIQNKMVKKVKLGEIISKNISGTFFQDVYKNIDTDLTIPNTIWGVDVEKIAPYYYGVYNSNVNIIIPNTFNYDDLKDVSFGTDNMKYAGRIMFDGSSSDCYIDDNILYSNDGQRVHMLMFNIGGNDKNTIVFGDKTKQIDNDIFEIMQCLSVKEIDKDNPYYFLSGDVIWSKGNMVLNECDFTSPDKDGCKNVFCFALKDNPTISLTNDMFASGDRLVIFGSSCRINIPMNFDKIIDFSWIASMEENEIFVDMENPIYYSKDGSLYLKSGDKLISGINNDNTISRNIKDIDLNTCSELIDCFSILRFDREYVSGDSFIEEDNLYTNNKEKILFAKNTMKIAKTTKEISDGYIDRYISNSYIYENNKMCNEIEVDEENPYFSMEDGILYDKYKTKLLLIPNKKKSINLPASLKEIDERYYKYFDKYNITVDASNETFEEYEGNLYTKGLEKLLAIGNVRTIRLPKNLKEISDTAIYQMCYGQISLDADNMYFECTKTELWKKGKDELISIIGMGNRIIEIPSNTYKISDALLEAINVKQNNSLRSFNVSENNNSFFSYDGCLYDKKTMELIAVKRDFDLDNYVFGVKNDVWIGYIKVHPNCSNISWDVMNQYDLNVFDISNAFEYQELLEKHARGEY